MFTGRDLIIYILQNNLEDAPVFSGDGLLGFMTITEAAVKFHVGTATIQSWIMEGYLERVVVGGRIYIPAIAQDPRLVMKGATANG